MISGELSDESNYADTWRYTHNRLTFQGITRKKERP